MPSSVMRLVMLGMADCQDVLGGGKAHAEAPAAISRRRAIDWEREMAKVTEGDATFFLCQIPKRQKEPKEVVSPPRKSCPLCPPQSVRTHTSMTQDAWSPLKTASPGLLCLGTDPGLFSTMGGLAGRGCYLPSCVACHREPRARERDPRAVP